MKQTSVHEANIFLTCRSKWESSFQSRLWRNDADGDKSYFSTLLQQSVFQRSKKFYFLECLCGSYWRYLLRIYLGIFYAVNINLFCKIESSYRSRLWRNEADGDRNYFSSLLQMNAFRRSKQIFSRMSTCPCSYFSSIW